VSGIVVAILLTVVTLVLLVSVLRSGGDGRPGRGRRERRDRQAATVAPSSDPGEALALVGNALAATHDPRALLPIILEVVVDATGARGGRLVEDGAEMSWIGETHGGHPPLMLELARQGDSATNLFLYPGSEGFTPETRELAEWLASQAAIALENARLHHLVQRQASTDDLTGLVNRRRFIEALGGEITRASTFGTPLSVILGDLDDFKLVNDVFGHHVGDEVLRRFASLIEAHLRDVDVPGRLGGEEFAILLPDTDATGATAVAERIRSSLSEMVLPLRGRRTITATFGVAQHCEGEPGEELLRRADVALYRGKSQGKNTVAVGAATTLS
jgi:diguanylate cyclase (GGDEF)-like protein